MKEYSFVLDIQSNIKLKNELLNILNNNMILVSSVNYQRYDNIYQFKYVLNDLVSPAEIKSIDEILDTIGLILLSISYKVKGLNTPNTLQGIKSFILPLVEQTYSIKAQDVNSIERYENDELVLIEYFPCVNNSNIYIKKNNYEFIDLSIYDNFTFLSTNELTPYVVSNIEEDLKLTTINEMYCMPNDMVGNWKEDVLDRIENCCATGMFVINTSNIEERYAAIELARYWEGEIKRVDELIVMRSKINFDMTPKAWYCYNCDRIMSGKLPRYRFPIESKELDSDLDQVALKYKCTLAYNKLLDNNPELISQINDIIVHPDNTVELPFFSYQQYLEYNTLLNIINETITVYKLEVESIDKALSMKAALEKGGQQVTVIENANKVYLCSLEKLDINININYNMKPEKAKTFQLTVRPVNIYKDEISRGNEKINTYTIGITEDEFLYPMNNIYYLTDQEYKGYSNELSLIHEKDNFFDKLERLQVIYEGNPISSEEISRLWQEGKFMKEWSKHVYKKEGLFSRLFVLFSE